MKSTVATFGIATAALASCGTEQSVPVERVVKNIHILNGQTLTVAGYLAECAGYECRLYVDEAHAKQADIWFKRILAARKGEEFPSGDPLNAALGIGIGQWVCPSGSRHDCYTLFDQKAAPFQNSYVLITGKVTNQCRDLNGKGRCLDRSTDFEPVSIRAWKRTLRAGHGT